MKTIQEMLQELSQCIVTVSGEFRFRTNWNGGKVPQPDLDVFDPNVPFCIENVGDVPVEFGLYNSGKVYSGPPIIPPARMNCKISYDLKSWQDYEIVLSPIGHTTDVNKIMLQNKGDRVYIKADYKADTNKHVYTTFVFIGTTLARYRARGNVVSLNMGTDDKYKTDYLEMENDRDSYRFYKLFDSCIGLTQAPDLPATTLADCCYSDMFRACWALTQAPELPATTLAHSCYGNMFQGCTYLTQAPELPATTLAYNCYASMFRDCKSLTQVPELPATTLDSNCYISMFSGCTSIVHAPELPATTLAQYCYYGMFSGCTSLNQAPELPATTLADSCYSGMFSGCTKLNYVKCLATDTSATNCTKDWLSGVSSTGTFECDNKKYFTLDNPSGIPKGWTITEINPEVEKPDLDTFDPNVPFCIENVGDVPVEIGMYDVTSNIRNTCEISYNNKDWITYNLAVDPNVSDIKKINLTNKGDRVYIKSNHSGTTMSPTPYTRIKVLNESDTTKIQARGNIASLTYARNDEYKTKYNTTENSCYLGLFMSCKSLIKAPDLVATVLSKSCYMTMFNGCTNLKYIKCLATNISASNCTNVWVVGVSSTGDFYAPASTTWVSGANGIPSGWTRHDIT